MKLFFATVVVHVLLFLLLEILVHQWFDVLGCLFNFRVFLLQQIHQFTAQFFLHLFLPLAGLLPPTQRPSLVHSMNRHRHQRCQMLGEGAGGGGKEGEGERRRKKKREEERRREGEGERRRNKKKEEE